MKQTMQDLINKLNDWKGDIDCDIKADWISDDQRNENIRQSIALSTAIGILNGIGDNNNIPKNF